MLHFVSVNHTFGAFTPFTFGCGKSSYAALIWLNQAAPSQVWGGLFLEKGQSATSPLPSWLWWHLSNHSQLVTTPFLSFKQPRLSRLKSCLCRKPVRVFTILCMVKSLIEFLCFEVWFVSSIPCFMLSLCLLSALEVLRQVTVWLKHNMKSFR